MSRFRQRARWRPRLDIPHILAASALPSFAAAQTKTDSSDQTDQQTIVPDSAHEATVTREPES